MFRIMQDDRSQAAAEHACSSRRRRNGAPAPVTLTAPGARSGSAAASAVTSCASFGASNGHTSPDSSSSAARALAAGFCTTCGSEWPDQTMSAFTAVDSMWMPATTGSSAPMLHETFDMEKSPLYGQDKEVGRTNGAGGGGGGAGLGGLGDGVALGGGGAALGA